MSRNQLFAGLAVAALALGANALRAPKNFDLADPKGVSAISFTVDSRLEPFKGAASAISGNLVFNPDRPESTSGEIVVATDSLQMTMPLMTDHLHGDQWLNAAENPEIRLQIREVMDVEPIEGAEDPTWVGTVFGELTLNGVTKEIEFEGTLTYLEGMLGQRMRDTEGDLVVLRAQFDIDRLEFDINPGAPSAVVGETIEVDARIVGILPAQ